MFRTTITITAPAGTVFSTVEEFMTVLENYYDESIYENAYTNYINDNKVLNKTETLTSPDVLTTVVDWDSEISYLEFYSQADDNISLMEIDGYIREVTTETI